jgi:hypothetical protein
MTELQTIKIKIIVGCIVAAIAYLIVSDVIAWLIYGGNAEEYQTGEMLNNRFRVAIAPVALLILLLAKIWHLILWALYKTNPFRFLEIVEPPSENFTDYIP